MITNKSNKTLSILIPWPLLLEDILSICGTFTRIEPAIIPSPKPLESVALKHGTANK